MDRADPTVAVVCDPASPFVEAMGRLAALAGLAMVVVPGGAALVRAWRSCVAVVVDAAASALVPDGLGRRERVALVGLAPPDDADVWRFALRVGASEMFVLGPDDGALVRWLAMCREPPTPTGRVVAVVGACGGVGTSTFASALALTAARDAAVTLVDGDPYGGGLDLLLGAESAEGLRWPQLCTSRGVVPAEALRAALPQVEGVAVLSWSAGFVAIAAPDGTDAVLSAACRGSDVVVLDAARPPDLLAAQADVLLLVVPAAVRAVVAAATVIDALSPAGSAAVSLVVRHPGPADIPVEAVSERLGHPVLVVVGPDPRIAAATDRGEFVRGLRRSPIADAAAHAWAAIATGDRLEETA